MVDNTAEGPSTNETATIDSARFQMEEQQELDDANNDRPVQPLSKRRKEANDSCGATPAINWSGGVVVGWGHGGPIGARALQALAVVVGGWLLVAWSRLRLWSDSNRSCVHREGSMEPLELSSGARVPLLSMCL